ncbi:MAG TPA: hypothetical protein VJG32_01880 [Anaerolineae bacterium]|nr:hypothetical protein [Anaerolineae bacterium]
MDAEELKKRTKQFGLRCIKVVEMLPKTRTADVLGRQLLLTLINHQSEIHN